MALKLGDAAGAMEVYLDLLSTGICITSTTLSTLCLPTRACSIAYTSLGAMPANHELLQRKLREATAMLSDR